MSGRSHSVLRKHWCLMNWLSFLTVGNTRRSTRDHSTWIFLLLVIASETGSKPWAPPALSMSELAPDGAALHPSQLEPQQGCGVGALPTWLSSCEMSPAIPTVWMPSFQGTERPARPVNYPAAFLPPWIFWLLHCIFLCVLQLLCSPQVLQLYQ